jgi:O-antigen/teichoic acid export membrane protein
VKIIPDYISQTYKLFDDNIKEFLNGTIAGLLVKSLAAFSNFAFNIVVIRKLGVENSGYFFVLMSFSIIISAFSRMGVDNSLVKNFAILSIKNSEEVGSLYLKVLVISLISSSLFATICISASSFFISIFKIKVDNLAAFSTFAVAIPLITINVLNAQSLQGIKSIKESLLLVSCVVPLSATIMLMFGKSQPNCVFKALSIKFSVFDNNWVLLFEKERYFV